jgi:hypothetical protein
VLSPEDCTGCGAGWAELGAAELGARLGIGEPPEARGGGGGGGGAPPPLELWAAGRRAGVGAGPPLGGPLPPFQPLLRPDVMPPFQPPWLCGGAGGVYPPPVLGAGVGERIGVGLVPLQPPPDGGGGGGGALPL